MLQKAALYLLLLVVAAAAAVLSFDALRGLALLCGFSRDLAWLLPVTVDAGAAAASIVWLGTAAPGARAYGRTLALVLLASSVGGNALGHGLAAFRAQPHWLVVVGVSAIAPAVLGALVHLVVLAIRPGGNLPAHDRPVPPDSRPTDSLDDEIAELLADMTIEQYPVDEDQADAGETVPARAEEPGGLPDRRAAIDVSRDGAVIDDLRALAKQNGRRYLRDDLKAMYGMGSHRATRLLNLMGWLPREDRATARAEEAAR